MFYQVGDQQFKNKFRAAHHAALSGQNIHFNMYETEFDRANWTAEPLLTWDQLLDIRAQQIAAKNKPIVLNFSGGTDSLTIYEVFKRNNIHIDVIFLRRRLSDMDAIINEKVLEFFNKGLYDPTTKIVIRYDNEEVFKAGYGKEDWIWNTSVRYHFSQGYNGDATTNGYLANILGTDDFVSIIGFEKPRLLFTDTGVYSYQDDTNYIRPMNSLAIDCFFISPNLPELHIKQSYMMLNYIKSINPGSTVEMLKRYNEFHDPKKFNWYDYSIRACGRFGDLSYSADVHKFFHGSRLLIPKNGKFEGHEHKGPGQNWFKSLTGTELFKNYTKGILDVVNDPAGKYLLKDPSDFYSMRAFNSKGYKLTF